jgi:hypothetical protein
MTRAELDAVIAARRATLVQARKGTSPASPTASPATAPVAHPTAAAPRPAPVITAGDDREARHPQLRNARPPAHYLAGEREPFREHVSPSGFVAPGAGRGD